MSDTEIRPASCLMMVCIGNQITPLFVGTCTHAATEDGIARRVDMMEGSVHRL